MISREDLPVLRRVGRSPRAMAYTARLVLRYAMQRLRAHRGTSLVLGNALAARLLKSARDLGVEIVTNASVLGLDMRDGRVVGVRAAADGRETPYRAAKGVILATGGISTSSRSSPRVRACFRRQPVGHRRVWRFAQRRAFRA